MRVSPAPGDQPAMPGQQGGGCHAEGCPGRARKESTEGGQQCAIGGLVGGTCHLAPEYLHLVAQSEELDLLGVLTAKEQEDQLEQLTEAEVDEGPQLTSCPVPSHRDDGSREDRSSARSPWWSA